jgi:hypothetical protein
MLKYEGHDDFRSRFKTGSCGRSIDAVIVGALGSCAGLQRAHADQVVRRRGEEKLPIYASAPAVTELAQPGDGLHPAEDFFNALARPLTDVVAGMSRRASIERAALLLEGNVRPGLKMAVTILHEDFAEIGELRFMAFGFLEQATVGIGRRLMRLIRAPFAVEIDCRLPGSSGGWRD